MEYNSWKAEEGTKIKKEYVAVILAALLGTIGFLETGDLKELPQVLNVFLTIGIVLETT